MKLVEKKKIVLIEDETMMIDFYKEVLGDIAGFDVLIIDSFEGAFSYLKNLQEGKEPLPDLILLDLLMPATFSEPKAIDFLLQARSHPKTKDLKIFAFTNYSGPEFLKEVKRAGADRILIKIHFSPQELIYFLKRELGLEK